MPKHYTPMSSGAEYDLLDPKIRRYCGFKAETLAWTKAKYRRRERRVLKRELAELVESEAFVKADEQAYLWRKLREADDYYDLVGDEILWLEEVGEEIDPALLMEFMRALNRSNEAYNEWFAA